MTSPESITPAQMHRIPAQQDDEAADQPITTPEDLGLFTSAFADFVVAAVTVLFIYLLVEALA